VYACNRACSNLEIAERKSYIHEDFGDATDEYNYYENRKVISLSIVVRNSLCEEINALLLEFCYLQVGSTNSHMSNIASRDGGQTHCSSFIENAVAKADVSGRIEFYVVRANGIKWGEETVSRLGKFSSQFL
jgi:hypothetical protein